MAAHELTTDEGLRAAVEVIRASDGDGGRRLGWAQRLAEDIDWVRSASLEERASLDFQVRLWESNSVSAVGMGTVPVQRALEDAEFRRWVAERSVAMPPPRGPARTAFLREFLDELIQRLGRFEKRKPHLKIYRVLALFYPGDLTTLADRRVLKKVFRALGGQKAPDALARHAFILERLEAAIGRPEDSDSSAVAEWIALPWDLWRFNIASEEEDATVEPASEPGDERLVPLPPARRRRGLTILSGGFSAILGTLEFLRDGVTREELLDHLRSEYPSYKDASLRAVINSLQSEFAVIRLADGIYRPTERGEAVLESEDASPLADWLLTHILGVDRALVYLRDVKQATNQDWILEIQAMNPGWTTLYAPSALSHWLRLLGLVELQDGLVRLTEEGQAWADLVHWMPEPLPAEPSAIEDPPEPSLPEGEAAKIALGDLDRIVASVRRAGHFAPATIAQLHAGLWSHPRRHFAILTGLSGTGKTLLAREYAKAIVPDDRAAEGHLVTVAVQPGWYDPSALLGYVNPLRGDAYVRTHFLEFLLRASGDPGMPYVVVLDEMNLSHPEQYMAPLLSAMETGARIVFHSEGGVFDGIPPSIPYPSNLVVIGTVNMDETTHGLSDKVLDRAYTMEFWQVDLSAYPRWNREGLSEDVVERARSALVLIGKALAPARLHFGWRVVDDVLDFLAVAVVEGSGMSIDDALDSVVLAKIVPKLRGDDAPRFRRALEEAIGALDTLGLPRSLAKVRELQEDLVSTGSARFWR